MPKPVTSQPGNTIVKLITMCCPPVFKKSQDNSHAPSVASSSTSTIPSSLTKYAKKLGSQTTP
jgi:hypothetical protein